MDNYDFEMNKLRIEKAAVELFSNKQYKNVTMDDIAKKAELTKRTVYRYFPSKTALAASIFESYLKRLNDEIAQVALKDIKPEKRLMEITRTLFRYTNENKAFMKMFWMLSTEYPPELLAHLISAINKGIFIHK